MALPGEPASSWICPNCSRRVPTRIETCRCGAPRPAPSPAPALAAPIAAAAPSAIAASAPPSVATGVGFDEALRSPKEGPLFLIGAALSSLVWLALLVSIVGAFYGLIGIAFSLVVHALYLAHVRGNALRVSETQLPEIHAAVVRAARTLGMPELPEVYVAQAGGVLNAFATKFLSRKFVIVYSDLVDACEDPRQLEFVISHELGHLAAGHLKWNAFLAPFMFVPLLGTAYSRAREYTSDRCGLSVVNDLEVSMRGLIVLAAGGRQAARADIPSFMQQRLETGSFWSAVVELGSTHPFLCKRVAALQEFAQPGSVAPVGRNPLAYPLAPFLAFGSMGGGGASLLIVVAMIGIIAAIAIPSLLRARVSANESMALGDLRTVVAAESAYAQAARAYGSMECLVAPGPCIVGFQGAAFLPAAAAADVKSGYRRALRVGPAGQSFVYVTAPVTQNQTGVRTFCADSDDTVCASTDPEFEKASLARCDRSRCRPLP